MVKRTIQESDSSEDEKPLIKRTKPNSPPEETASAASKAGLAAAPSSAPVPPPAARTKRAAPKDSDAESSDDEPIAKTKTKSNGTKPSSKPSSKSKSKPAASTSTSNGSTSKKVKKESDDEMDVDESEDDADSESEDEPLAKKAKRKAPAKTNGAAKKTAPKTKTTTKAKAAANGNGVQHVKPEVGAAPSGSDIKPKATVTGATTGFTSATASPVKGKGKGKGKVKKEEDADGEVKDEDDDKHAWWLEDALGDGTKKWTTLEHNGVLFPPEYVPLPKDVMMKYDGKPVPLPPEAEEVAGFFGAMLETDHVKNPKFVANFFKDWQKVMEKHPPTDGVKIKSFEKCDFTPMFDYFQIEKEKKKSLNKDEKKAAKEIKDALEEPYKFCKLDGRTEKVGNFRVEPPGLFRGRGDHPKTGMLKTRVMPEQITINIGPNTKVPEVPEGHKWEKVSHNDTVTWLATWKENINGATKYVFLAAGSTWKGQSDMKKFEKARNLKDHIDRIRKDYTADLTDKQSAIRQRATAMYLIDKYALRAGNEKGDEEADTVGCCSLRCEHITLEPNNIVIFDFLGKDSIRFYKQCEVDTQVAKNLRIFKKDKDPEDALFDRLSTSLLNKHLTGYMPGLTAKVFRTYNASFTFQRELAKTDPDASIAEKILAYNRANREVALLCNHQRSVSKNHSAGMEKLADKLRALKYQRRKIRITMFTLDPKLKKKHKDLDEPESDMDDEWIAQHEIDLVVKEREKITKKFEKENQKLAESKEALLEDSVLKERMKVADEMEKTIKKEAKTGKVENPRLATEEKCLDAIEKINVRIEAQRTQVVDKEEGKDTALSTSKINYLDPRITYAWCAKHNVPIEKLFSKTLRDKFTWAAVAGADWIF